MKKIIVAALLAASAMTSYAADRYAIVSIDMTGPIESWSSLLVDNQSIVREPNNVVTFWTRHYVPTGKTTPGGQRIRYKSAKTRYMVQCNENTISEIFTALYTDTGFSDIAFSGAHIASYDPVIPDSAGEKMRNIVCK
jgi:hypothetical protein